MAPEFGGALSRPAPIERLVWSSSGISDQVIVLKKSRATPGFFLPMIFSFAIVHPP